MKVNMLDSTTDVWLISPLSTPRPGESYIFGGTIEVVTSITSKRGENPQRWVFRNSAAERKDGLKLMAKLGTGTG